MILLLPVSRFRVTYEVGAGRPYSRLEELVCRMIAEAAQPVTLAQLRETFHVHDRLLIESVVTLVRAGWAAMNLGEGLAITEQGRQTLSKGGRPQSTTVRKASTSLYMERVCGLLERETQSALNLRSLRSLRELGMSGADLDRSMLTIRNPRNSLSIGQAQGLLPHRAGEWIRWVGEPRMHTKGNDFVPLHVDLASSTVTGLPRTWEPLLTEVLLRAAHEREEEMEEFSQEKISQLISQPPGTRTVQSRAPRTASLPLPPGRAALITGKEEFLSAAQRCIEDAETSVLIMVSAIDAEGVKTWERDLKDALKRGLRVDVLWGETDTDSDGLSELKRIAFESASGPARTLRFNARPAGTVSQIVVADHSADGAGTVTVILGGVSLLHTVVGQDPALPALKVSDPGVAAQIARAAAGWWAETAGEDLSASTDRWRRLASSWEESAAQSPRSSNHVPAQLGGGHLETAQVLLDADCATLEYGQGRGDGVIVRAYPAKAADDDGQMLRGAAAVHLRGPSWSTAPALVTEYQGGS
ncbi:phospholipase D-like domain-containing protein [Streptomyces salyersiae]|uniref:Helicase XPB/Ssl2 N-terminal domain-containing protein n=1 Tax=Streptomyces salyersiae TaxID=3075530 RepID=A0ABU2RK26_9ACTN|nr:hypothetical protein [Streptomyces sp. DSM 41770]MDT0427888.1 hypothetical protein [Streptomyces sp. DSM 41770]